MLSDLHSHSIRPCLLARSHLPMLFIYLLMLIYYYLLFIDDFLSTDGKLCADYYVIIIVDCVFSNV